MENNKITILYLLQKVRLNKQGKCPVRCRVTYNQKRKEFSTGLFINPDYWNSKQQKAHPSSKENDFINTQISLITQKLHQAFLFLQVNETNFDVADIYSNYKGEHTKKQRGFLEVLELHNDRMKKLVGKEFAPRYLEKWVGSHTLLKEFIRKTYRKNDILLENIKLKFLDDLDFYMKSEKNHKQITINKCIQRIRKIIKLAISEGFLEKDPFIFYKPKRYKKEIVFLTQKELNKIESYQFVQKRLEQVRDLFIFCCYTGLAYAEMSSLRANHIVLDSDGNKWISMYRKKTSRHFSTPLLNKAIVILDKYKEVNNDRCLPKISNQRFNSYIKEICEIVGIEKVISHHIARKTFATTVLLYNDVPMEIVSELLGHSKISVTQEHYAKVIKKSLSSQMKRLNKKLK